jgi:probable F420-dependent oxidoreductase
MQLGKLGVWAPIDTMTSAEARAFAQSLEKRGYQTLWTPESRGRNVLVAASWLLAGTTRLNIASGIANIYARDAMAAANAHRGLNEQSGGRFLLGLGVSHVPLVTGARGHTYGKPVATMRAYLEAMKAAPYQAPPPAATPMTVLAALGPQMLKLAAEQADGAHPYCVTPAHTAMARKILGPGKILAPEQMVVFETDPAKARAIGRANLVHYTALDNYANNWRRLGFSDADMAGGGTDAFVDANIAWGDVAKIRQHLQAHWDAGADHVCIQALHPDGSRKPDERIIDALAPASAADRPLG